MKRKKERQGEEKIRINLKNNKRSLSLILKVLFSSLTILPKFSLQQCAVVEQKGIGYIRIRKLASNNTLLTVDHWIVLRVMSLSTYDIQHEIDLKPFFSQTSTTETSTFGGYFIGDNVVKIIAGENFYSFDISTETMTIEKAGYTGTSESGTRGYSFHYIPGYVDGGTPFFASKFNFFQIIMGHSGLIYKVWTPDNSTYPLYSSIEKITAVEMPSLWPKSRFFATTYPNMVGYYQFDGTSSFNRDNLTEGTTWTNVTSNIAVKESQDLLVYGMNKTDFIGGVRFRKLDLTNRFVKVVDTPFISCQLDPSADVLVTYYVEGQICLIAYNLAAKTITPGNCFPVAASDYDIEFMNGKLILFKESTVAVYNYPAVTLSHVYAPQPLYMEQAVGETDQLHIFPGVKIRVFDTITQTYNPGNLFDGVVYKAYLNPHTSNSEVFVLVELSLIKRVRLSDGNVLATYNPISLTSVTSTYRDCYLLSFDLYKLNSQKLFAMYRCYKISDGTRANIFIDFDYTTNTANAKIISGYTNNYVNQIRMVIIDFPPETDIIIAPGSKTRYLYQPYYSSATTLELFESSSSDNTHSYDLKSNIEILPIDKSYLFLSDQQSYSSGFDPTNPYYGNIYFNDNVGRITNCLKEASPVDNTETPAIQPQTFCGGSMFLRTGRYVHGDWEFKVSIRAEVAGAIFRGSDGEVYIQANEGTRVKYTGNTLTCYKGDADAISIAVKGSCSDPNCIECKLENAGYCRLCVTSYFAINGICVSSCPVGWYEFEGQCLEDCPLNYYKLNGIPRICVDDCSSHSPNIYTFGDRCSNCPSGSSPSGSACLCSSGKLAKEDHTCVTASGSDCPSGFYWFHYEMCIDTVRNSTEYSSYNGKYVYCDINHYADFNNQYKCITADECSSPRLKGTHPDYGNVCVTSTQCKTTLSFKVDPANLLCLANCEPADYLNVATSECITACPSPTVYSPTANECLASCPSTPTQYYVTSARLCETKADCTGVEELYASVNDFKCVKPCVAPNNRLVPSTLECQSACPTTPTLTYYLSSNTTCETAASCGAITTPSQHYSTDSSQVCATSCASGLYKHGATKSCLTALECQGLSDGYTNNSTMECVPKATCTSQSRLTVEDYNDCTATCPNDLYSYDVTKTCETLAACQAITGRYTKDDSNSCSTKAQCTTATMFTVGKECVASCASPLYSYQPTMTCETEAACKAISGRYARDDVRQCITKAECDGAARLTVENDSECVGICPSPLYSYSPTKTCETEAACKAISGRYARDDLRQCITKAECDGVARLTVESDSECVATCPSPLYSYSPAKTCVTLGVCQGYSDGYTREDQKKCITKTECDSASRFTNAKDCVANCPNPLYSYLPTKTCVDQATCQGYSDGYTRDDTNQCLTKAECNSVSRFTSSKTCVADCSPSLYSYIPTRTCETKVACEGITNYYTRADTNQCLTKVQCDSASRYTNGKECVASCLAPLYSQVSTKTCKTQAECQAIADGYTQDDTMQCINKVQCSSESRFTDSKNCVSSCPSPLLAYLPTRTCETRAACQSFANYFTKNDTNQCILEGACISANYFTIDDYEDCAATCPGHLYTYPPTKKCLDALECQALSDRFTRNDTMNCITSAECTSASRTIVPAYSDCMGGCAAGEYFHSGLAECKTQAECQSLNFFTKNDSMTCISKSACTGFGYFTVDEYKDCDSSCPPGELKYSVDHTCKTPEECISIPNYYTRNDTDSCVSGTACVSSSRYLVASYRDCDASCPSDTYLRDDNKNCLTLSECQALDYYTNMDTSKCITEAQCTGLTRLLLINTNDCVAVCPPSTYLHSSNSSCLTQEECQTASFYTNNDTMECLSTCSPPKFFDESIKDCADSCPPSLYGYVSMSQCLTIAQCVSQGADMWAVEPSKTCENGCLDKKEANERICHQTCPQNLFDGNFCYSELEISIENLERNLEDEKINLEMRITSPGLILDDTIISSLRIETGSSPIIVSDYQFDYEEDQISISFSGDFYKKELTLTVAFDTSVLVQTDSNDPFAPKNYYLKTENLSSNLPELSQEEEGPDDDKQNIKNEEETEKGSAIVEMFKGMAIFHSFLTTSFPLIAPLFSPSTSTSSYLTYMAQTFNKLLVYSFFGFKMTEKIDELYLDIFQDLMDEVSEYMIEKVEKGSVDQDFEETCRVQSWRFCHVKVSFGFLTSQTLTVVMFLFCLAFLGIFLSLGITWDRAKKVANSIKISSIPNFWIGNQLQLIFAFLINATTPYFGSWVFTLGYVISISGLLIAFTFAILVGIFKKGRKSNYLKMVVFENMKDTFNSIKEASNYLRYTFIFDSIMALSIICFQRHPIIQSLIWLLGQTGLTYYTFKKVEFKSKTFTIRTRIIEAGFLLLSAVIFVTTTLDKENEISSWLIIIKSCIILSIDVIFGLILSIIELIDIIRKKKAKNKTAPKNKLKEAKGGNSKSVRPRIKFNRKKAKDYLNPSKKKKTSNKSKIFSSFRKLRFRNRAGKPKIKIISPKKKSPEIELNKKRVDIHSQKNNSGEHPSKEKLDISINKSMDKSIDISQRSRPRKPKRSTLAMKFNTKLSRARQILHFRNKPQIQKNNLLGKGPTEDKVNDNNLMSVPKRDGPYSMIDFGNIEKKEVKNLRKPLRKRRQMTLSLRAVQIKQPRKNSLDEILENGLDEK